ncbi:MAG TPA: carbohydrate binding domain-containing protein [Actinocrinis sp.]|uniref:carbohydrate binding domain-containing protein n=1 Tax=Actinocrinis sp. TaxID=1920516 RepID=UPI002DDCAC9E|nr:carbohydrate binding domain-containing protein [Actinocrinis sp.]HEV2347388.1 carbohydrate binding domain-containing protein [Actinocrinis sp.]
MATPKWSAPRSGLLGDNGATNTQDQLNQLLGTHDITPIYQGTSVLTPQGSGGDGWTHALGIEDIDQPFTVDIEDVDQPFTLVGTTVGRVAIPVLPVGDGADLIVSLCSDSGGAPGSVITQTKIPANWITSLAAVAGVAGPTSQAPITVYTGSPLATAAFNVLNLGATSQVPWPLPAVQAAGSAVYPSAVAVGGYLVLVGGVNTAGGTTSFNNVFTITADADGNASPAVPQPAFPTTINLSTLAASTDPASGEVTIISTGGQIPTPASGPSPHVFTASLDTATGTVGAWNQQADLPIPVVNHGCAAVNGFAYAVGGTTTGSATTRNVYYGPLQNGQITTWTATTPLPVTPLPGVNVQVAALDSVVLLNYWDSNGLLRSLYAPANANGTLGTWQSLPAVPDNTTSGFPGNSLLAVGNYGVFDNWGDKFTLLSVTPNGPGLQWYANPFSTGPIFSFGDWHFFAPGDDGSWQFYMFGVPVSPSAQTSYVTGQMRLTPSISIPLPAVGLTNGATYHVLMQQAGGTLNDYLWLMDDFNVFPGNPTALFRDSDHPAWHAGSTGHAIPIQVFDKSATGPLWHLWDDGGARITTSVQSTTPGQNILGVLEATMQPGPVLNQWPTFADGIGPWHPTGATLTTSAAQTQGNLPLSALLTPSGSATLAYAESDLVPIQQGHQYILSAWYYSPTGYSDVNLSANWFSGGGGYISTTSGTSAAIPANTWTFVQTTVTANIVTAAFLDIVAIEGSTPPATALLYISAATVQDVSGPQVSTVTGVTYGGSWPSPSARPPLGTVTLA